MEVIMRKVFAHKCKTLLTRAIISFVILSILTMAHLSSPSRAFAKPLTSSDIQQSFQDFCDFYYSDEPDNEQANDVPNCEAISDSFVRIIPENFQSQWPDQSLEQLAIPTISSADDLHQALLDAIGDDPDLQALITDDPDF